MLGERELVQVIEANEYPARVIASGLLWVELEFVDPHSRTVARQRLSKSMFADLILDWRERRAVKSRELRPALRKIGIAA